ncbi:transcription factor CTF1 [Xylariaceae sp. FL1272]|nr:transcription factor CTF1 [Xylariaceae sp. FL1272]
MSDPRVGHTPESEPSSDNDRVTMANKSAHLKKSATHSNGKNEKDSSSSKKRAPVAEPDGSSKVTKRRAARACVSCRTRKVRCDVVENYPCGNCKWDGVLCEVQPSRRRKKSIFDHDLHSSAAHDHGTACGAHHAEAQLLKAKTVLPNEGLGAINSVSLNGSVDIAPTPRRHSAAPGTTAHHDVGRGLGVNRHGSADGRIPKLLPARSDLRTDPTLLPFQADNPLLKWPNIWQSPNATQNADPSSVSNSSADPGVRTPSFSSLGFTSDVPELPGFICPLPVKIVAEDVEYMRVKGALSLPSIAFQNSLLRAYIEYVHPYMPLLELHDLLSIIDARDGSRGRISLFLYQAIMFSAVAFVKQDTLKEHGYPSTKVARRVFFYQTRLLYDMDYERDRLVLIQGLLLMSYWYETPDDQKDTWHWMGVAISLAHSIGLHRDTATRGTMTLRTQRLWKRIWWSCFMRDRMVALGMRRPTRIKDEDFDVPMLEEADFEIGALSDDVHVVGPECLFLHDVEMQHELAQMCIAKARLCLCVSHLLDAQYSISPRTNAPPDDTINSRMMLAPNEQCDNMDAVAVCDAELHEWMRTLPPCCEPRSIEVSDLNPGRVTMIIQRSLLHLTYCTAVSALHRPQFLRKSPKVTEEAQSYARLRVWESARGITSIISELLGHDLVKYLPTTSVTVILPAMIIHMLQMKVPNTRMQQEAKQGFNGCMEAMKRLSELYAAADYAIVFLSAAMDKCLSDPKSMLLAQHLHSRGKGKGSVNSNDTSNSSLPLQYPNIVDFAPSGVETMTTPPSESDSYPMESQTLPDFEGVSSLDAYAAHQSIIPSAHFVEPSVLSADDNAEIGTNGARQDAVQAHSPPLSVRMESIGALPDEHAAGAANADFNLALTGDQPADLAWDSLHPQTGLDFEEWLQFPAAPEVPLPVMLSGPPP